MTTALKVQHVKKDWVIFAHHQLSLMSPLPSQSTVLKSTHNKVQLIEIITKHLLEKVQSDKKLVITSSNEIPEEVQNGVRRKREDLRTSHEEADPIIPQQVLFAAKEGAKCVKIVSDDTDFFDQQKLSTTVLMEETSEQWKMIDIGKTVAKHKDIIPSLIAAHTLSGCDSVPQMFGIGKKTILKKLKDYPLRSLGKLDELMVEIVLECMLWISW